jgi:MSHA pilin protein MshD
MSSNKISNLDDSACRVRTGAVNLFVNTRMQRGISLIELIMFIVIVSVALAGILLVMNTVTRNSADPMLHKQALAIAESLLEEVELMPFTFCDPNDPAAGLASTVNTSACTAPPGGEAMGPEPNETRYSTALPFDNVNDYNNCQMNTGVANAGCDPTGTGGIRDITNTAIGGLEPYRAAIAVAPLAFNGIGNTEALQITVRVWAPDDNINPIIVEGIRTRYAPTAVP